MSKKMIDDADDRYLQICTGRIATSTLQQLKSCLDARHLEEVIFVYSVKISSVRGLRLQSFVCRITRGMFGRRGQVNKIVSVQIKRGLLFSGMIQKTLDI
ncbi:hypothetical protein CEXT_655571 [Caerostris extrusa]|uniref:Uncharacterized protein n=1 Tax=Caerostris extrusa TaxID=172846 RepID=A0AAV4MR48_CAEEX|nr:hypothetical protein CEXT_655571 [Caerostris extrusa]